MGWREGRGWGSGGGADGLLTKLLLINSVCALTMQVKFLGNQIRAGRTNCLYRIFQQGSRCCLFFD